MRSTLCILAFVLALGTAGSAAAQGDASNEIAAIRAEIAALTARLDRLERTSANAGPAVTAPVPAPARATPPPATEVLAAAEPNLKFSGDFRYRHEAINEEGLAERERQRIRARFGVTADVSEKVRVGLTLATGNDDPISGNQTLDGGFSRKSIGVDRAFFAWQATEQLSITGGKMANPFFRPGNHHLIYDSDLNPEGLALRYNRGNWFANYAGLWVDERSGTDDSILLGGQVGYRSTLDNGMRLTVGASYYDFLNTQGRAPFFDGAAAGNRVDGAGGYLNDFNEAELFGELRLKLGAQPLTVFADYVENGQADAANAGFAVGATYGEVSGPGTWRFGYAYQNLEADAVIGTFTDSDFGGGGTDSKGHVLEFSYGLRERWAFGVRYFLDERGIDAGNRRDYNRLQADLTFAY